MQYVSYAQAVSAVRTGLQVGYLHSAEGTTSLGALENPTQGDLLLAVLGAHSVFSEDQEIEGGRLGTGLAAMAAYSDAYGCWQPWSVAWYTHFESGLTATFTHDEHPTLVYNEGQPMAPELAALLNASRWPVV